MKFTRIVGWVFETPRRIILAGLILPGFLFYLLGVASESVYEAASPSNRGTCIFDLSVSPGGMFLKLLVRDYEHSGRKPIFVAIVDNGEGTTITFRDAVWSKDGSVVVTRTDLKVATGCYDFQNHVQVDPGDVDELLAQRGGVGQPVLPQGYALWDITHHLYPWEFFDLRQ